MRKISIATSFLFIGSACFLLAAFFWKQPVQVVGNTLHPHDEMDQEFVAATSYFAKSQFDSAYPLILKHKNEIEKKSAAGMQWYDLLVALTAEKGDAEQLLHFYDFDPTPFAYREEASLLVAEALLNLRDNEYLVLRKKWKDRETLKDRWLVLDADALLLEGKRDHAIELLQSMAFQGKADTGRLIRLAFLTMNDNPKQAWDYLTTGYRKDPQNPEIRSYRGKILESFGKNTLAHTEYLAAVKADPDNPLLHHELADFYLRNRNYGKALEVWENVLPTLSNDLVWEQAFFWNKVTKPIAFDWQHSPIPQGSLTPLVAYFLRLDKNQYWNDQAFETVSLHYLKERQSTFWLKLLAALKEKKEDEALRLLELNSFHSQSWNPELERALTQVLTYRKKGVFAASENNSKQTKTASLSRLSKKNFFQHLENFTQVTDRHRLEQAMPDDLRYLLKSEEVFAAAFLASGWNEAALQMPFTTILADECPDWVIHSLTHAIKENRGNMAALEFATMQKPTDSLTLLIGELLIAEGSPSAGLKELQKLKTKQSQAGYRANWLMSLLYIDQGELDKARGIIVTHPRLSKDVLGYETLARIALLEGNEEMAADIYSSIEEASSEAKSFLAQRAFVNKDWTRARELTERLLAEFPNNAMIRENLAKIIEEQDKTG